VDCSNLPHDRIPRESVELIAVEVQVGGTTVDDYELAIARLAERPEDWAAPTVDGDHTGYLTPGTLDPGSYILWARADTGTQQPVIPVRRIDIT
jgi:hypothetical protein